MGRIVSTDAAGAARRLGAELRANVVMYGVVKDTSDGMEVTPEFYFAPRDVTHPEDQQSLLTAVSVPPEPSGWQSLGTIRESGADAAGITARAGLRSQLERRARAFAFFIVGLAYYTNAIADQRRGASGDDNFAKAGHWFALADGTHEWDPRVANVLYVFLGNVALELSEWTRAEHDYAASLRSHPGYDRAEFGLAEARFHQASGACAAATRGPQGLVQARNGYAEALKSIGSSDAVLRSKAQFGLGRAALCLGADGAPGQYALAQRQFSAVAAE